MKYTLLLCIIICALVCQGQVLENIKPTFSGDKVIITYDLSSPDPNQKFKITAFSGHDNYASPLQHVAGAVGDNISVGKGLRIEWDAKSSLPSDFNGVISVRLKGVAMAQLNPLEQAVYKKGSNVSVAWTGGGKADKMNIELIRNDKVYKTLGSSIDNTNSFTWKIPAKLKAGKGYSLRLTDVTDPMQPSTSSTFEVKSKIPLLVKLAVPVVIVGTIIVIDQLNKPDNTLPALTVKPD